jgi:hypothetical protein
MAAADAPSNNEEKGLTESEVRCVLDAVHAESNYDWTHWRSSPSLSCWKQAREDETNMIQVAHEEPVLVIDDYEEKATVAVRLGSRQQLVESLAGAAVHPQKSYQVWKELRDRPYVQHMSLPVPDDPSGLDVIGMLARQAAWDNPRFGNEGEQ